MNAPRGDRGEISLIGLLVATVLSLIILLAVLDTFDNTQRQTTVLTARNANQDTARAASDALAAAARNLASPTPDQPRAIDRALPFDLIFQDVDPAGPNAGQNTSNVRRERWCLGTDGSLYGQRQTWTTATVPAAPAATSCPASGWATTSVDVKGLRNLATAPQRALFTYDAAALSEIAAVHVDMYLDEDPTRDPPEVRLSTGVFLRNQNRPPTASFTATPTPQGIVLNASASTDPEGQPLTYSWLDGGAPVGAGVTASYKVVAGSTHALSVRVQDPAGLTATSPVQTVRG